MNTKTNAKEHYTSLFQSFEESLNGAKDLPIHQLRKKALAKFTELDFPTKSHEEWKYTNITPIISKNFTLKTAEKINIDQETIDTYIWQQSKNILVFCNGEFCSDLSKIEDNQQISIENFDTSSDNESLLEHLNKNKSTNEIFSLLNTTFLNKGVFIRVGKNSIIEDPIYMIHLSNSSGVINNFRHVIVVEENAQVSFIENIQSIENKEYFNNVVTDVFVDASAQCTHLKIQQESTNAYRITNHNVHQEKNSVYTLTSVDLGGSIVRNNVNVYLNGTHCESNLYGFYMGKESQLLDNHTFVDHANPNCNSNELYKGIMGDKSKAVFNGKVLVRQIAQKTNAYQSNQNILLSDEASVDTKPQLEIFADDVKCSHGATIGALDESALFYLRARGVNREEAHLLLRQAFAAETLQKIKQEPVREKIQEIITSRF